MTGQTNITPPSEGQAESARQKFVLAFNKTMLQIWQEQITLLEVIGTGRLLNNLKALPVHAAGRFYEVSMAQR